MTLWYETNPVFVSMVSEARTPQCKNDALYVTSGGPCYQTGANGALFIRMSQLSYPEASRQGTRSILPRDRCSKSLLGITRHEKEEISFHADIKAST